MSEESATLKCELCDATSDHATVQFYEWPVQDEITGKGINACDTHAAENGFCPICHCFVLGISISDELCLQNHECCADCWDDILAEGGDYEDEDDEYDDEYGAWDYYPEYVDIIEEEEGGRYIGEGSDYLPESGDEDDIAQ